MPTPLDNLKAALRALFAGPPATSNDAADGIGDAVDTYHNAEPAPPEAHAASHTSGADQLADMVGDSGAGGVHGLVPAPAAGDAAKVLSGAGTWVDQSTGADPPTVYFPFLRAGGASNSTGAAGRIRTGLIYVPPMQINKIRYCLNDYGTTTDRISLSLYRLDGTMFATTGAINTYALFAPGGPWIKTVESSISGGPVTWGGGNLVVAFACKEGNTSILCVGNDDVPTKTGQDPYHGYPVETTLTGAAPASITLPPGTADTTQGRCPWVALVA